MAKYHKEKIEGLTNNSHIHITFENENGDALIINVVNDKGSILYETKDLNKTLREILDSISNIIKHRSK